VRRRVSRRASEREAVTERSGCESGTGAKRRARSDRAKLFRKRSSSQYVDHANLPHPEIDDRFFGRKRKDGTPIFRRFRRRT
jgi:hypothetical protein